VLVLALGNLLLHDDGAGQAVLVELGGAVSRWGSAVELLDGGTLGLALMGLLEGRAAVVILDAVALGAPPGTVHVLCEHDILATGSGGKSSVHEIGAVQLLRALELIGQLPSHLAVVGIEPESVDTGIGLSPAASAALTPAAQAAAELIDAFVRGLGAPTARP
jgi:hydrogenase maturation protease